MKADRKRLDIAYP